MKWQPIETAPRDETRILVINGETGGYGGYAGESSRAYHIGTAYFYEGEWLATDCCDGVSTYMPTHWMPLPEPPNEGEI